MILRIDNQKRIIGNYTEKQRKVIIIQINRTWSLVLDLTTMYLSKYRTQDSKGKPYYLYTGIIWNIQKWGKD